MPRFRQDSERLKYESNEPFTTASLFGERKRSSPQLRLGSCSASLRIQQSWTGLAPPGSANPSPCFHIYLCGVAFALKVRVFVVRRRSSLVTDALAVTARGGCSHIRLRNP